MIPFVLAMQFAVVTGASDSPVTAVLLRVSRREHDEVVHSIRLKLENVQDHPVWFLLPYWGDEPLAKDGVFKNDNWPSPPFGGLQFEGKGGSAYCVNMYGGDGFKAFRLPAKGTVELEGYPLSTHDKEITEIEVVEAKELKVNGKTALENWLPYHILSDRDVKISERTQRMDRKNLNWDAKTQRDRVDFPQEKVTEIKATGMRRLALKFETPGQVPK